MKKLALVGIVLFLVGAVAFAESPLEPLVTLAGSGTLTWGIDLESRTTGFSNAFSSTFSLALVASRSDAKGSEEDGTVYGYINLTGIGWTVSDDTVITALDSDTTGSGTGPFRPATISSTADNLSFLWKGTVSRINPRTRAAALRAGSISRVVQDSTFRRSPNC